MPIYVQSPGGKFDSAGQGMAAAQQYRGNEQKIRQQEESFEFERGLALRKVEFEEQQLDFDREQLASQQEAEADALLGMAIESGTDVGDQGAYKQMLMRTSPRFRSQMATELGRATRLKAQEAELDEIMSEIELTPETQAKVQSGALVEPGAIRRSMAAERGKIARTADQESARLLALESWQKRQAEPNFDMPDPDADKEAHGDVMEILGELSEGAATNPKTNYRALNDQLTLLTTKGMRAAAMALLQRDIGGVDPRGLPRSSRMGAMQQPGFAEKAEGEYVDQRGDDAQAARNADDPGYAARQAKGGAGNPKPADANGPTGLGPKDGAKPKSVADLDATTIAGGKVDKSLDAVFDAVLADMGLDAMPPKGSPARAKVMAEVDRRRRKNDRNKYERTPSGPF